MGVSELDITQQSVAIPVPGGALIGSLSIPAEPSGLVVFAHGSGSGRLSPRNQYVAGVLNRAGLATFLFDLLTPSEAAERSNVFDVALLGSRLALAGNVVERIGNIDRMGYFGASTGAAAALWAAAERSDVYAVVSRGGRPDLAGDRLPEVRAPTLLIVGGLDTDVLELNRQARARMTCETRLEVIPCAAHLFEEPGALETVATLARDWFSTH